MRSLIVVPTAKSEVLDAMCAIARVTVGMPGPVAAAALALLLLEGMRPPQSEADVNRLFDLGEELIDWVAAQVADVSVEEGGN